MLMMLAGCRVFWAKTIAADAHDAGRVRALAKIIAADAHDAGWVPGFFRPRPFQLMLMMLAGCRVFSAKTIAADGHDAGRVSR